MPEDFTSQRALFGGTITSTFPLRFQDVSAIRQVPDHQEVFVDPTRDESLIFELLDLKADVLDQGSATWFLQDLANEQDAEGTMVLEQSGVFQADGLQYRNIPSVVTTATGKMGISKGRQGTEAQNIVKVYLANLRLKEVGTDVLITAYEPMLIKTNRDSPNVLHLLCFCSCCPLSESASTVGAGVAVPAAQSGLMPMAKVFKLAVSSFKGHWRFTGGKEIQGYAYILTHPGTPSVFYDHIFSELQYEISTLISVRNRNKINCRSTVQIVKAERDVYATMIDEKLAMKIGPGHYEPSNGSGNWSLVAEGRDYKIWETS